MVVAILYCLSGHLGIFLVKITDGIGNFFFRGVGESKKKSQRVCTLHLYACGCMCVSVTKLIIRVSQNNLCVGVCHTHTHTHTHTRMTHVCVCVTNYTCTYEEGRGTGKVAGA